jgi:hypothetical protein
MKSIYILCLLLLTISLVACKKDATVQQEGSTPSATQENQATPAQDNVAGPASEGGHDYTFLTDKILIYKAAFAGGTNSNEQPYKDQWIDLMPDGKFKAGKLKEQTHTGLWTYNHDTNILLIKPDNNAFKMSEWKVMYNNQMMVWVGTQTYGNQSTQIQLVRSDQLP